MDSACLHENLKNDENRMAANKKFLYEHLASLVLDLVEGFWVSTRRGCNPEEDRHTKMYLTRSLQIHFSTDWSGFGLGNSGVFTMDKKEWRQKLREQAIIVWPG